MKYLKMIRCEHCSGRMQVPSFGPYHVICHHCEVANSFGQEATLPEWSSRQRKAELLKIAQEAGLDVTNDNLKTEIITALESLED